MNAIFIAGTDTGVGKTVVTGLFCRYLLDRGYSVVPQKWVGTGSGSLYGDDINTHLKFIGKKRKDFTSHLSSMAPYNFRFPASPHLAAELEWKKINIAKIIKATRALSEHFDFVVIEGAGGLLVPLTGDTLVIDIVEELKLPTLIVAANKLGAINHSLLSTEALRSRGIKTLGIIFNNISKGKRTILNDNPRIVDELTGGMVLGILPKAKNLFRLQRLFEPIGDEVLAKYAEFNKKRFKI